MPTLHRARLSELPAETLYRILWLRVAVFVVEQRAAYLELDGRDLEPATELLWIEDAGEVVATARLMLDVPRAGPAAAGTGVPEPPDVPESSGESGSSGAPVSSDEGATARIGRVATAASARGRGLAADLVRAAVERSRERWPRHPVTLDAQAHLEPWYGRFGFVVSGPGFDEDGIPHVPMTLPVP